MPQDISTSLEEVGRLILFRDSSSTRSPKVIPERPGKVILTRAKRALRVQLREM